MSTTGSAAARRIVRATALTVLSLAAAALTWRLRPTSPTQASTPDAAVVAGCAWLAWSLVGYLSLAVAVVAASHLVGPLGGCRGWLVLLTPSRLRQLVDRTVMVGLATTVAGLAAAAPASAATHHAAGALDWPGLTMSSTAGLRPVTRPAPTHRTSEASRPGDVVVRSGDSLWSIAAGRLGSSASTARTSVAWREWYAANRSVIGADPGLIYPGERLHPPADHAPSAPAGGTR